MEVVLTAGSKFKSLQQMFSMQLNVLLSLEAIV